MREQHNFLYVFIGASTIAASLSAQVADPGNFVYTQNKPSTNAGYLHSYLVGYQPNTNGIVLDQSAAANPKVPFVNFNSLIGGQLDPGGVAKIHDADFFFQECFGGGMISSLPTAMGTVPWVAGSASTYWQTALATPKPNPLTQPQYATWSVPLTSYLFSNPSNTVLSADKFAYQNDFFGPNGIYRETPQYASYNAGNALTLRDAPVDALGGTHYGVIFVGDISTLNQSMINVSSDMVNVLTNAWAGKPFKVAVLYGDGGATANVTTPAGKNLAQTIANFNVNNKNPNEAVTLAAGTPAQLNATITGMPNTANDQFLFFGFDHGGKGYSYSTPVRKLVTTFHPAADPPVWSDTFSLESPNATDPNPNPNGELIDTQTEEDPTAPPSITIGYTGLSTSAAGTVDVLVNGVLIGSLDPTGTSTTLAIPQTALMDVNTLTINDNSGQNVNILSDEFDSGALPPEVDTADVPEPAAVGLIGALGALLTRRRRS